MHESSKYFMRKMAWIERMVFVILLSIFTLTPPLPAYPRSLPSLMHALMHEYLWENDKSQEGFWWEVISVSHNGITVLIIMGLSHCLEPSLKWDVMRWNIQRRFSLIYIQFFSLAKATFLTLGSSFPLRSLWSLYSSSTSYAHTLPLTSIPWVLEL